MDKRCQLDRVWSFRDVNTKLSDEEFPYLIDPTSNVNVKLTTLCHLYESWLFKTGE